MNNTNGALAVSQALGESYCGHYHFTDGDIEAERADGGGRNEDGSLLMPGC